MPTRRGAWVSARWGLRAHRGTAGLVLVIAAGALAAALPVTLLVRESGAPIPRLLLAARPAAPAWADARTPAALQQEAVTLLFGGLFGAALATLALASVTVLMVLTARTGERLGEAALRRAVGASRRTLLLAALLEAGVLAGAATLAGGAAAAVTARLAAAGWPGPLAAGSSVPTVLAGLGLLLAIVLGATLAFIFARRSLAETGSRSLGLTLSAVQLGVGLIVLTGSALLVRQATGSRGTLPVRPPGGVVFEVTDGEPDPARRSARYAELLQRLRQRHVFDSVSLSGEGLVAGLGTVGIVTTDCGFCPFGGVFVPWHSVSATHQFVSADSFQALGVRLVAGRGIDDRDGWSAARVAVVSRALAATHFQDGQAIGRRLLLGNDPRTWHTVVGVVDDPPAAALGGAFLPPFTVYASVLQHPEPAVDLLVRRRDGGVAEAETARAVAGALRIAPSAVVTRREAALLAQPLAPIQWFGRQFAVQGWVMLAIAAVGAFVQLRLWVLSLRAELGLRRALGARRAPLLGHVLLRAAGVGAGGLLAGLLVGPVFWSALGSVVRGLPPWDAGIVLRFAVLLVATAVVAAMVPAWRAVRAAPAESLGAP